MNLLSELKASQINLWKTFNSCDQIAARARPPCTAQLSIPPRKFIVLRHKERQQTQSSLALEKLCLAQSV